MLNELRAVTCRDRTGQDRDVVVGHTPSTVWLRVAGEERLLDTTQAEALYIAIGKRVQVLATVVRLNTMPCRTRISSATVLGVHTRPASPNAAGVCSATAYRSLRCWRALHAFCSPGLRPRRCPVRPFERCFRHACTHLGTDRGATANTLAASTRDVPPWKSRDHPAPQILLRLRR